MITCKRRRTGAKGVDCVTPARAAKRKQMRAVRESSTAVGVVAAVKSMGLPGGLGTLRAITKLLEKDTTTPCHG